MKKWIITVKGSEISVYSQNHEDYISLTDMVRNFEDGPVLIEKWRRNKNTIEFMFQLTNEEFENLRFHFGTSSWGGTRKLPYAFSENGVGREGRVTWNE